jgi:multidrug efflux system outer membrane protein
MKRWPLLPLLALAGCSMVPAYQRPAAPVPVALPQGEAYPKLHAGDGAIDAIGWHEFFPDARLQRVITAALSGNRDLRVSVANVAAARAQYRVARAAQLPTVTATPAVSRYHGAVSTAGYTGGDGNYTAPTSDAFGVSGGIASFELDLWGRVRSLGRAALETWLASDEGRKAAQTALIAQVAQTWLTIGADADALGVVRETLKSREATLALARQREAQGIGTQLEIAQAETLVASARADVAADQTALAQATNALQLLVGGPVPTGDLPTTLGQGEAVLASLPVGLDSTVLLRRPDVLAAEHQLRAANANVGAARAALFPTISLTGVLGLASGSLGGLFNQGGVYNWGLAGSATQTLFDGGARKGTLAAARAQHDAAIATYEKAVQSAFSDVANALARRGTIDEQLAALQANVVAAEKAAAITDARYRTGVDAWLPALDAARTAYVARQSLVATRLDQATNMVTLYEVLGGGLKP